MKQRIDFVEAAQHDASHKQPPLELVAVSVVAARKAQAIGIDLHGKTVALDHDGIRHTHKKHGGDKEYLRGQIPITPEDFALFGEIFNKSEFNLGVPPVARDGSKLIEGTASANGFDYGFVARVRRKHVVPQTLWKRSKK